MGCLWSSDIGPPEPVAKATETSGGLFGNRVSKETKNGLFDQDPSFFDIGTEPYIISAPEQAYYSEFHCKETTKVTVTRDAQGNKIVNQYALIKTLGLCSYGKVKLCVDLINEQFYAIKLFHKGALRRKRIGMSTALQVLS